MLVALTENPCVSGSIPGPATTVLINNNAAFVSFLKNPQKPRFNFGLVLVSLSVGSSFERLKTIVKAGVFCFLEQWAHLFV